MRARVSWAFYKLHGELKSYFKIYGRINKKVGMFEIN